jgi:hypothetical protein
LDLGVFTIDAGRQVLVLEQVTGTGGFEEMVLRHHGRHVAEQLRPEHRRWRSSGGGIRSVQS